MDKIKNFFSNLGTQDLPTGVAALAGIVLILFMFKTGKLLTKLLFFLIAAGLFAGAYWWHTHK
jgi:high-affinity Fe2+/Pb2+ permease